MGEVIARTLFLQTYPGASAEEMRRFAAGVVKSLEKEFENLALPKEYVKSQKSEIGHHENGAS